MVFFANILKKVKPSATLILAAQADQMKKDGLDIVNMTVGEPNFSTPEHIKEAAKSAIDANQTRYTSFYGIPSLRQEIIKYVKEYYDVDYDVENTIVTCGAKQAIYNALKATLNPNDEVIIITPYWVSYIDMVQLNGGNPVICNANTDGNIDLNHLQSLINAKTKWIILNSPNNPSGFVYNRSTIENLINILNKNTHIHVLTDDIYHRMTYNSEFINPLHVDQTLKDRILIINGFSKSCAMTGWRVGFAVGASKLIQMMGMVQSQSTSCICSIAQHAALSALQEKDKTDQFILTMNKDINEKRLKMIDFFHSSNIDFINPSGAFYFMISCKKYYGRKSLTGTLIENENDFAEVLLKEYLISTVPGNAFGMQNYIRISYAVTPENIGKFTLRMRRLENELS